MSYNDSWSTPCVLVILIIIPVRRMIYTNINVRFWLINSTLKLVLFNEGVQVNIC